MQFFDHLLFKSVLLPLLLWRGAIAKPVQDRVDTNAASTTKFSTSQHVNWENWGEIRSVAHSHLLLLRDCPIPCGYAKTLCCNDNEICYTAPNDWAECAPRVIDTVTATAKTVTASAKTITAPGRTITAHDWRTRTIKSVLTTRKILTTVERTTEVKATTITRHGSTYRTVVTRLRTATKTLPANPSESLSGNNGNSTLTLSQSHHGWPEWEKGAVGAAVIVGIGILAAAVCLFFWRKKRSDREREDMQRQRIRNEGPGYEPPLETAHFQRMPSQSVRPNTSIHRLQPRQSQPLYGHNPYDRPPPPGSVPPYGPDDVAPPYPGSRSTTPGQSNVEQADGFGGPSRQQRQEHWGPSRPDSQPFNPVPPPPALPRRMPRRPGGGMRTPIQEDDGY